MLLSIASTALPTWGCSGETGGEPIPWQVARDTIGDTVVVRTLAGSVWGAAQLIEEVRIGQFDGPEELTFGDVAAIAAGLDGTVYVLDRQGPNLRAGMAFGTTAECTKAGRYPSIMTL